MGAGELHALNGTTRFLWGGDSDWQCLEERDSGGDLVARYTYSPGYIDAVAVQERDLNDDQDFGDANEVVYYHSSTLYSVYALTDASESVVERCRYDAYGAATVLDDDWSADADGASDVGNPYAFTGRRTDAESALMQYRNRYHSPALDCFVSRDPAEYRDGYGLYTYVSDKPVLYRDPMGLKVQQGPAVAADVAAALDNKYKGSNYHWGHAHCVTMCMIVNLSSVLDALACEGFKEDADTVACLLGNTGACYSANQESDYAANRIGYQAPSLSACTCVRAADIDLMWPDCFDACVGYCEDNGWGADHRATPPGRVGAERGLTVEKDGYLDYRWPEKRKEQGPPW